MREYDDLAYELQDEVTAAGAKARESESDEDDRHHDALNRRLVDALNKSTALSQKLQELRSPGELDRRVAQKLAKTESIRRLKMSTTATESKTAKVSPADQGVPAEYLREDGAAFRTGMDARLKSDLVASITGEVTKAKPGNALCVFEPAKAKAILEARGWMHFLERKQAIIAEKEAKKAKAQAEREEAARAKAAEKDATKAAKAAEKAQAAETAQPGSTDVTPDPKPTSTKRSRK